MMGWKQIARMDTAISLFGTEQFGFRKFVNVYERIIGTDAFESSYLDFGWFLKSQNGQQVKRAYVPYLLPQRY
jgi:hypothetical protein